MSQWVTVKVFMLPQDAYIAEGNLKANNIETFLKDELTIQSDNFLSNAIGGVKLQVLEHDLKKAINILTASGYIDHSEEKNNDTLKGIDKITSKIKLFGKPLYEFGILEMAIIVIVLIAIPMLVYALFQS
ncbi:MAG: hypothetical protein ACI8XB_002956 [Patiriisocius sp.]|jgi:hypothetical protein